MAASARTQHLNEGFLLADWRKASGEVIEKIWQHCGLWQASAPRAPPDVDGLVLELDSSYSDSPIGSPGQADQSQELTYVDIDTFLASF